MTNSNIIPKWFFIVAVIAALWNVMGIFAYIATVTISAEDILKMPQAQQDIHNATPAWANGAFAIAVFGGFIGCLLLLVKKSLAIPVLIVSLIAVLTQMYNAFFIMNSFAVFGLGGIIMPIVVIIIAVLLIWLARTAKSNTWIN